MCQKRKRQQNIHMKGINRQRNPEHKGCLPGGNTSSLTSPAFKACCRQIYRTWEENNRIVIVVQIICISLQQISGELTNNYFENKIIRVRSFPAATQAVTHTCQLYFLQCRHNSFYRQTDLIYIVFKAVRWKKSIDFLSEPLQFSTLTESAKRADPPHHG